jgi:hypothetical protein
MLSNDATTTHQRRVPQHQHEELPLVALSPTGKSVPLVGIELTGTPRHQSLKFPSSPSGLQAKSRDHQFGNQFMLALTIAGLCSFLLSTVFGLFHVDVFLRVYRLPLHAYSVGSLAFSIVNTANDLIGAYLLDAAATRMNRSDLIGISGCIFALCFLTPFFRWKDPSENEFYDKAHFILSMSMYDTTYSFMAILLGSLITDNHHLTDKERVNLLASGKTLNLISAFAVAKIGLLVFDEDDMRQFRIFLVILAGFVSVLFLMSQILTQYHVIFRWKAFSIRFLDMNKRPDHQSQKNPAKLKAKQIAKDFWDHQNFWPWIWMELLLESQNSFSNAFLKTFVDRLVFDEGVSRERCDWLLSTIRPLGLVLGIFCYIPIRKIGYKNVYTFLFASNIVLCLALWAAATHNSTSLIVAFLMIYPAITTAVASSGFHL